jgi:putative glutathione S-transferase
MPPAARHYPLMPAIAGFQRHQGTITGRLHRDGSSGYPAEPGRYQLYAALACPLSHRALIVHSLLGLGPAIGVTLADPVVTRDGWVFAETHGGADPLTGARSVAELYLSTEPGYDGPCNLPVLWDTRSGRIASNDAAEITVAMETTFLPYQRPGAPDLYPAAQREEIEAISALITHTVSNGVYRAGLAASQAEYEEAFDALFTTLDALDDRLGRRRFLLGGQITEADVRLFPTLARFDAVYYIHYKCNLRRLTDYPNLWGYARDLYQRPGFGETTDFVQIKRHYYQSEDWINPSRIVPKGPFVSWLEPPGRDRFPP